VGLGGWGMDIPGGGKGNIQLCVVVVDEM